MSNSKPVRNFQQAIDTLIKVTALNYVSNSGASITRQIQMLVITGLTIKEISEVTNITNGFQTNTQNRAIRYQTLIQVQAVHVQPVMITDLISQGLSLTKITLKHRKKDLKTIFHKQIYLKQHKEYGQITNNNPVPKSRLNPERVRHKNCLVLGCPAKYAFSSGAYFEGACGLVFTSSRLSRQTSP